MENHKAVELGKAQSEHDKEKNKLNDLKSEKNKALESAKNTYVKQQKLDLNRLRINDDYVSQLSTRISGQEKKVDSTANEVDKRRTDLLHAARDKKVVEMLKDRYLDQYKRLRNQEEAKKEGEVAIRMQNRKTSGNKS